MTAIYRILPDYYWPAWHITPFFVLGLVAGALWLCRPRWRPVARFVAGSLVLYFAVMAWLITTFPSID